MVPHPLLRIPACSLRGPLRIWDLLPRFLKELIKTLPDIKYLAKVTVEDCVLNSYIRPHCPLVFLDSEYKVASFFPVMLC